MTRPTDTSAADDPAPTRGRRIGPEAASGALLAVGMFAVLAAVGRGDFFAYDGNIMYAVARNIVQHGSVVTTGQEPYSQDVFGFNTPYSIYGIGTSLLVVPATALELLLGTRPAAFASLMNPMVVAALAVVVQRIGIARGWSLRLATVAAIVCILGTPLFWLGTMLFSEPAIALCTAVTLLAAMRWREGRPWAPLAFGTAIAVAIQFRSDSIVLLGVAVVLLPLFVPLRDLLRDRRGLALLCGPILLSLLGLAWYDVVRFDSVLPTYGDTGESFSTPLFEGLRGLLASPSRGLFTISPFLLLALLGLVPLFRRDRAVAWMVVALTVIRLLTYARWSSWHGGVVWGGRFMAPAVVLLIVPTVEALRRDARWPRVAALRAVGAVLVSLSIAVSLMSVTLPFEQWWDVHVNRDPTASKAQVEEWADEYYWSVRASHVVGNLRLIENGDAIIVPYWWRRGPRAVGIALGLVGVGALAASVVASPRSRVRRRGDQRDPVVT